MRGLNTDGSWNCGLLFCRPHVRPAGDPLLGQAAGEARIGRQAGDAVRLEHRRAADAGRLLAGLGARHAEADFEQRASASACR